jgi:hypothetical protein
MHVPTLFILFLAIECDKPVFVLVTSEMFRSP